MKACFTFWMTAVLTVVLSIQAQKVQSCGVEWTLPKDHFDGVNERGYVSIWDQIGTLDLGEDLKIPLILGFQSDREWSSQHVGQGWILGLLDSRFEQVDENTFHMLQPDGWTIVFRREAKDKTILGGQAGWKAQVSENAITAYASCGWKLVYRQGKIVSITTPKDRTLEFLYVGARVSEIREKGAMVLRVKTDPVEGSVTGLIYGGKEVTLTQGPRPQVQKIKEQNLVAGMASALTEVSQTQGETKSYDFAVDEKLNPTLTIDKDRTITWDAASKRIIKDGEWNYQITPSKEPQFYAAIGRTNSLKQTEFWHLDAAKGRESVQTIEGVTTVKSWFLSGAPTGLTRKVEKSLNGKIWETEKNSYDERGRIIREINEESGEIFYKYDDKNRVVEKLRMANGKKYLTSYIYNETYSASQNTITYDDLILNIKNLSDMEGRQIIFCDKEGLEFAEFIGGLVIILEYNSWKDIGAIPSIVGRKTYFNQASAKTLTLK